MKTNTYNTYKFSELSETAKEKAISKLYDLNVDYEWWNFVYEDARNVLLKITSFDIDRNRYCKGEFIETAMETANAILENHGENCETYKTALNFIKEQTELVKKYSDGTALNMVTQDNEWEYDQEIEEIEKEFLKSILEDYSIALEKEYEYLTSKEAIIETIEANNYYFTEDGVID